MLLKIILVLLIIAMLVSLSGALKSLFSEHSAEGQSKTYKWLMIRVSLAAAIILVLIIGFYTGQLTVGAPWSGKY
jgi:Flp pilus assembly pilin Flp